MRPEKIISMSENISFIEMKIQSGKKNKPLGSFDNVMQCQMKSA